MLGCLMRNDISSSFLVAPTYVDIVIVLNYSISNVKIPATRVTRHLSYFCVSYSMLIFYFSFLFAHTVCHTRRQGRKQDLNLGGGGVGGQIFLGDFGRC